MLKKYEITCDRCHHRFIDEIPIDCPICGCKTLYADTFLLSDKVGPKQEIEFNTPRERIVSVCVLRFGTVSSVVKLIESQHVTFKRFMDSNCEINSYLLDKLSKIGFDKKFILTGEWSK